MSERPVGTITPSARLSRRLVRETHDALLRGWGQWQAIDLLACFARLKKWTVPCLARYWSTSEDSALRDMHSLQRLGVVACLQGRIHGRGGREPDIYFLTKLGARVLTRHLGLGRDSYIQAPTVALDEGERTKGGLVKHKVPAKSGQDAHDLACLELGVRHGWLDQERWETRVAVRYLNATGDRGLLVPDFYRRDDGRLWCIEVEGTTEPEHVRMKHARYGAMSAYLERRECTATHLTVVFTSADVRRRALRHHYRAFAGGSRLRYGLSWVDLEDALAADPGEGMDGVLTDVDYWDLRRRRRAYAERLLG